MYNTTIHNTVLWPSASLEQVTAQWVSYLHVHPAMACIHFSLSGARHSLQGPICSASVLLLDGFI